VNLPVIQAPPAGQSTWLGRAFDLYRRTTASRSALALVAANLVPLLGVLLLGWSLWTILAVYWVENGIVGVWNIPKILLAQGSFLPGRLGVGYRSWAINPMPAAGRAAMAVFFAVHYGLFWLVHGVFVLVLPSFLGFASVASAGPTVGPFLGDDFGPLVGIPTSTVGPFGVLDWSAVAGAALVLFLSHGASFLVNYLGSGEYRTQTAAAQVFAPYGRLVVLHVTIVLGAFAIAFLGAPILLLVILVVLKTALDLRLHLREHAPRHPVADQVPSR
jgi:hypothetical protein